MSDIAFLHITAVKGGKMKVYVSSTFVDLKEYRAAAIRILRQLGHEVVAMEDYVADSAIPLEKCLKDVQSCEAYVGIFAWRYGYIPGEPSPDDLEPPTIPPGLDLPDGEYGSVSITEWEYLQATADDKRPILSFLLEEGVPWPPHLIDGFEPKTSKDKIIALRQKLQQGRLVSFLNHLRILKQGSVPQLPWLTCLQGWPLISSIQPPPHLKTSK